MRVNDLHNCLPKTLLFKTFGERIGVMVFVTSSPCKPSCGFLFYEFDLSQSPVMFMSTYIQRSIAFKSRHLVLSMKRIPLAMPRHIMRRVNATVSAVRELQLDSGFPILKDSMRAGKPFKGITRARPHIMIAANQNHRLHLVN
jgi:hypothetical protein